MKRILSLWVLADLILNSRTGSEAQQSPDLHVVVNMVQLNVAVTDKNGNYITGLRPQDFAIVEDGIAEKVATFAEGNEPARSLIESADAERPAEPPAELTKGASASGDSQRSFDSLITGSDVFILFDTSNYM